MASAHALRVPAPRLLPARLAVALLVLAAPVGAAAPGNEVCPAASRIAVRIYDAYGTTAAVRERAQRVAAGVLLSAGVQATWLDCSVERPSGRADCERPPGQDDLFVRLIRSTSMNAAEVLGYSLIDTTRQRGQLPTVLVDRVHNMASAASQEPGSLMGRVIAHEAIHLLQGSSRHSERGLMRPHWLLEELTSEESDNWCRVLDRARVAFPRHTRRDRPRVPCVRR